MEKGFNNEVPKPIGLPLEPDLELSHEDRMRLIELIRRKRNAGETLSVTEQAFWQAQLQDEDDVPYKSH